MENQMQEAPLEFYTSRYRNLDPTEAANRTRLPYDNEKGFFTVKLLGFTLRAEWPEFNLIADDTEKCPALLYGFQGKMLVLQYLLNAVYLPHSGTYLSYRELPWGDLYDQNFQGRCVKRLAYTFAGKTAEFSKAAAALGGIQRELGDCAFDIMFMGDVYCRVIFWNADDEFPPSSQILFSSNTSLAWDAEALAVVGDVLISVLKTISIS